MILCKNLKLQLWAWEVLSIVQDNIGLFEKTWCAKPISIRYVVELERYEKKTKSRVIFWTISVYAFWWKYLNAYSLGNIYCIQELRMPVDERISFQWASRLGVRVNGQRFYFYVRNTGRLIGPNQSIHNISLKVFMWLSLKCIEICWKYPKRSRRCRISKRFCKKWVVSKPVETWCL